MMPLQLVDRTQFQLRCQKFAFDYCCKETDDNSAAFFKRKDQYLSTTKFICSPSIIFVSIFSYLVKLLETIKINLIKMTNQ